MKYNTFSVPYLTDERMLFAKEYLENMGLSFVDDNSLADFALLPIPAKKYMFDSLENKTIFYGSGNFNGIDYNKNEAFLLENANLTAEGAIALLKENSDLAIFNSSVLIIGYGRIAKALHKALNAFGAKVTVCCRSEENTVQAKSNTAQCMKISELSKPNSFDFVFNTVPHMLLTKKELDAMKKEVIIFDLASFPGGVDTLYAKSKKIKVIDGKALPSRYSKKSAGRLIGKTVFNMIKEELV